jgi:hypothetical protein
MSFDEQWAEFFDQEMRHVRFDCRGWFLSAVRLYRHRSRNWICVLLNEWEVQVMARGKSGSGNTNGTSGNAWTTFVEIRITPEDWEEMNDAKWTPDDVFDAVSGLLEKGYRVSFSYNKQNDSTVASLTCKEEGDVNEGKTLTAFSQGWFDALRLVIWKSQMIAKGNWSVGAKERGGAVYG